MSSTTGTTTSSQESNGYGNAWAFFQNVFVGLVVNVILVVKLYYLAKKKGRGMGDTIKSMLKDVLDASLSENTVKKLELKRNTSSTPPLQTSSPTGKLKLPFANTILEEALEKEEKEDKKKEE